MKLIKKHCQDLHRITLENLLQICLISSTICFPLTAFSGLNFFHTFNYHSTTDNVENFTYTTMRNFIFFGANLGKSNQFILGQNIVVWNKTHKAGTGGDQSNINLLELGPRLTFFMDQSRYFSLNAAYHPYVRGKRTIGSQSTQEISGSSYFLNISCQLRISKSFYAGGSINYHSISISEAIEDGVESKVTNSYSYIFPAIEFSLRF